MWKPSTWSRDELSVGRWGFSVLGSVPEWILDYLLYAGHWRYTQRGIVYGT